MTMRLSIGRDDVRTKRGRGQRRSRRLKNQSLDEAQLFALRQVFYLSGRTRPEYRGSFPGGFPTISGALADLRANFRLGATRRDGFLRGNL